MYNKVSIIIPIYNVEKYLVECLDSVVSQTYSNLDIILVNDGSPDNSNIICEDYLKKDKRVRLFNKENGGLSDARNYGKTKAIGEYILFLDSDDVIDKRTVEILLNSLLESKSDIAICNYELFYDQYKNTQILENYIFTKEEYIKQILTLKKNTFAWGTLIKRDLIEDIEFPKGRSFEDLATMFKIYDKCKKIVFTQSKFYKYRQRKDSISHVLSEKKINDYVNSGLEMCMFFEKKYDDNVKRMIPQYISYIYSLAVSYSKNDRDLNRKYCIKMRESLKNINYVDFPFKIKIKFFFFKYFKFLYLILLKIK